MRACDCCMCKEVRWLVTSKRKTGGVDHSEAISFGMPKGRERKGEAAPRKRNNRKVTKQSVTVQRIPIENTPQVQPTSPTSPSINTSPSTKRTTTTTTPNISYTTITTTDRKFSGNDKFRTKPVPASLFVASAEYFTLYFLHYCPPLTSHCFGCGNPLKYSGVINDPPGELVIVSHMMREWMHGGQWVRKPGNVYFHCSLACVQRQNRQP